ncbi:MAG: hypothetical protein H7070_17060 [Saprospiraceae bacterium]|nr:hypothetical protein [Pyrinomonadaceae bacterium]
MKILLITAIVFAALACTPNQSILNSANESATPNAPSNISPPVSSFENDLQSMRDADFNFIHVFRRKDGKVMDADDKRFMAGNTPAETNRRRLSDDGKAIITGSNYRFPPEIITLLTGRFDLEDHSKPESEIMNANGNSNAK